MRRYCPVRVDARLFLRLGADINEEVSTNVGWSSEIFEDCYPLFTAIETRSRNRSGRANLLIRFLINKGANIHATIESTGETSLMRATKFRCIDAIDILCEAGANVNGYDKGGNTALHEVCACSHNWNSPIPSIFDKKYDYVWVNGQDLIAVRRTMIEDEDFTIVNCLLKHGADINGKNNAGITPLMMAVSNNYICLVKFLLVEGANFFDRDSFGNTTDLYVNFEQSEDEAEYLPRPNNSEAIKRCILDWHKTMLFAIFDHLGIHYQIEDIELLFDLFGNFDDYLLDDDDDDDFFFDDNDDGNNDNNDGDDDNDNDNDNDDDDDDNYEGSDGGEDGQNIN
jgi:hypothetical protein